MHLQFFALKRRSVGLERCWRGRARYSSSQIVFCDQNMLKWCLICASQVSVGPIFAIICGIQKYLAVTFYVNSLQVFELVTKCPSENVTFPPSLDKLMLHLSLTSFFNLDSNHPIKGPDYFSLIVPQLYIYQECICLCGIDNFVPVFFFRVEKKTFNCFKWLHRYHFGPVHFFMFAGFLFMCLCFYTLYSLFSGFYSKNLRLLLKTFSCAFFRYEAEQTVSVRYDSIHCFLSLHVSFVGEELCDFSSPASCFQT